MNDMKKALLSVIVPAVLFALAIIPAYAHDYGSVTVEIPFVVEQGGTAQIIPQVNSPVPDETEITVADGETGTFHIHFDTVGEYSYTVKVKPDPERTESDDTVYSVKVYINDDNGELKPTVVAYKGNEKYAGYGDVTGVENKALLFVMGAYYQPDPPPPPPDPDKPPKTGDDTNMERNFLIAMIASIGLLIISIVYLDDTLKLVKEQEQNE